MLEWRLFLRRGALRGDFVQRGAPGGDVLQRDERSGGDEEEKGGAREKNSPRDPLTPSLANHTFFSLYRSFVVIVGGTCLRTAPAYLPPDFHGQEAETSAQ